MTASRNSSFPLVLVLATVLGGLALYSQESTLAAAQPAAGAAETTKPAATPAKKAVATPAPTPAAATPAPKKPGILTRIFGSKATPSPAAHSTPATPAPATPKPKPKKKAESDDSEETAKKHDTAEPREKSGENPAEKRADTPAVTTGGKSDSPPADRAAPATEAHEGPAKTGEETTTGPAAASTPKPAATPKGRRGAKVDKNAKETAKEPGKEQTKEERALETAIKGGDAQEIEDARYDYAKVRAANEASIKELMAKADGATTEEDGRKALRAYNRALFEKMRKLEPSISDRVDRMEKAVMKRLEAGKGGE